MRHPVRIGVSFEDGAWVYEFAPLRLRAFAPSHGEALAAFREDFAACWDSLAQESNDLLTEDAIAVKRTMLDLARAAGGSSQADERDVSRMPGQ